jgi:hypothetical protein
MIREYRRDRWPDAGSIRADLVLHRFREGKWQQVAFTDVRDGDIISMSDPKLTHASVQYRACGDVFVTKNEDGVWTYGIDTEPLELSLRLIGGPLD